MKRCAGAALVLAAVVLTASFARADTCGRPAVRVAIDVGHYLAAPGATSARGVSEFVFNLRLSRQLGARFEARGYIDQFLIGESGARIALKERVRIANEHAASIFLSIHHDSVQPKYLQDWTVNGVVRRYADNFSGFSLFVSGENRAFDRGRRLAISIGDALLKSGFRPTLHHAEDTPGEGRTLLDPALGVYRWDRLGVVRTTRMPAVLVEAGVIVNRAEEAMLSRADVRRRISEAIVDGVDNFVCGGES